MFNKHRENQFKTYNKAREHFIKHPEQLIKLEHTLHNIIFQGLSFEKDILEKLYNEASHLYPFWQNYPPDNRGRQPKGDQFPWIEVGEHAIGSRIEPLLSKEFKTLDYGLPGGSDERFVVSGDLIEKITKGLTKSCWVFIDIKSVGPRDDQEHTVISHNQLSGDGTWDRIDDGVKNKIMTVKKQRSHEFHCSMPPIFIMSDGTVAPVIMIIVKPVYSMLSLNLKQNMQGQPLNRVDIATIPNGLLLTVNPNYLNKYPKLLFPGKDSKDKNPKKLRARVDFKILRGDVPLVL